MSAPDAVDRLQASNPEVEKKIVQQLDEQDREHLLAFSDPATQAQIATCMREVSPRATAAVEEAETPVVNAVIQAHQAEIDAAKKNYEAAHPEQSRP